MAEVFQNNGRQWAMGVNTKKKPPGGDVLAIGKNTATL